MNIQVKATDINLGRAGRSQEDQGWEDPRLGGARKGQGWGELEGVRAGRSGGVCHLVEVSHFPGIWGHVFPALNQEGPGGCPLSGSPKHVLGFSCPEQCECCSQQTPLHFF